MIDSDVMLSVSCILLGLWGMLNAAQWIASAAHWRAKAALGWDIQGLRSSRLFGGGVLRQVFTPRLLPVIGVLQFVASLLLCVLPIGLAALGALLFIAATNALLILRSSADGADKMAMAVTYGLLLQMLGAITAQPVLSFAGVFWVGCQLTICYATSGFSKAMLSSWRNGAVPRQALSSYSYGNPITHMLMRYPFVTLSLAWCVILLEAFFPLALFAPLPVLITALGGMALLHLSISFAMGLNTYVFAFIAAYPSVMLLAQVLRSLNWSNLL